MHRPQSASSRDRTQHAPPANQSTRLKTEEKDNHKDISMRDASDRKIIQADHGESPASANKQYDTCDVYTNNPELDLKVDKKLLGDRDWGRHLKNQCLCRLCTCGKHVCHLHPIKLGMTLPDSTYARSTTLVIRRLPQSGQLPQRACAHAFGSQEGTHGSRHKQLSRGISPEAHASRAPEEVRRQPPHRWAHDRNDNL